MTCLLLTRNCKRTVEIGFSFHEINRIAGENALKSSEPDAMPAWYHFSLVVSTAAKEGQVTEVSYMFPKPGKTDATPVAKVSLVTRIGNLGCGVGYYK